MTTPEQNRNAAMHRFASERATHDSGEQGDQPADQQTGQQTDPHTGQHSVEDSEAPPPLLGRWRNLYLIVLGELAVLVAIFYALTRWAS